jgi:hypothetical protein
VDFRVGFAGTFMRTIADDHTFIGHHARADDRIWRRAAETAARLFERAAHPSQVPALYHFSWNSAST